MTLEKKLRQCFPEVREHLAGVIRHIVVLLPCQLRDFPCGHAQGLRMGDHRSRRGGREALREMRYPYPA